MTHFDFTLTIWAPLFGKVSWSLDGTGTQIG
jgi:hypothetical protein